MNLAGFRGFFKDQLTALKLKEWTQSFGVNNIPATISDKSFHLDFGRMVIGTLGAQNRGFQFDNAVTLKMVRKGFKDQSKAVDDGLELAQTVIQAIVQGARALDQQGLKIVLPTGLDVQPFSQDNEHAVVVMLSFKASFVLGF